MYVLETIFKLALANTMIKTPLDYILTSSKLSCINMCLSVSWCVAVSYSKNTRNCTRADTRYMITDSINLVPSSGWQYYQMFPDACPVDLDYKLSRPPIGLCYRIYNDRQETNIKAKSVCKNEHGSLIKLDTVEKNEHIKGILETYTDTTMYYLHIGAERTSPGVWIWYDGAILNYTNWGAFEPHVIYGEDCAALVRETGYQWANLPCGWINQFICEKQLF